MLLDDETRVVLAKAKGIVAQGWCQRIAIDDGGRRCIIGAIYGQRADYGAKSRAARAVEDITGCPPPEWNDREGRTQAEVVALFDRVLTGTAEPAVKTTGDLVAAA